VVIPQVRSVLGSVLLIAIMGPIGGVALASLGGELHGWKDIPVALNHGAFMSVGIAAGWIFFRSPWAVIYQQLTQDTAKTIKHDDGGETTIATHTETTIVQPPEKVSIVPSGPKDPA
jgi:hypothetical protein